RGWTFIRSAGSLILAISILVWAAAYYPLREEVVRELTERKSALVHELEGDVAAGPRNALAVSPTRRDELLDQLQATQNTMQARWLADSYLGRAGQVIEPAVRPLGWDWRIGCAAIASFPAREV